MVVDCHRPEVKSDGGIIIVFVAEENPAIWDSLVIGGGSKYIDYRAGKHANTPSVFGSVKYRSRVETGLGLVQVISISPS